MLNMRSHMLLEGPALKREGEILYYLTPQSWSWQQAEYKVDADTLAVLRQDDRAQLILIAQDSGDNIKINFPKALLNDAELIKGQLTLYLSFTSDANSRLRSRDYFWVILSQAPGEMEFLMRPNIVVQESHWPANFFQEVFGAWGDEFDQIEARLQQGIEKP